MLQILYLPYPIQNKKKEFSLTEVKIETSTYTWDFLKLNRIFSRQLRPSL